MGSPRGTARQSAAPLALLVVTLTSCGACLASTFRDVARERLPTSANVPALPRGRGPLAIPPWAAADPVFHVLHVGAWQWCAPRDSGPAVIPVKGNRTSAGAGSALAARRPRYSARAIRAYSLRMLKIVKPRIPTGKVALATTLARMARLKIYSKWIWLLQFSGWRPLMEQYIWATPVTVLAPTDWALKGLPESFKKQLYSNKVVARKFLQYHMLQQVWPYAAIQYFLPSPYPTVLGPWAWRQFPPPGKKTVSFGTVKRTPVNSQAPVVAADIAGKDLFLIVVEGIGRCMIPRGVFK